MFTKFEIIDGDSRVSVDGDMVYFTSTATPTAALPSHMVEKLCEYFDGVRLARLRRNIDSEHLETMFTKAFKARAVEKPIVFSPPPATPAKKKGRR